MIMNCWGISVTGLGWGIVWCDRFFINIRVFWVFFHLIEMLSFQELFVAIVLNFILKSCFIALNVKIDVKFGFEIFCNNMSGSLYSVLEEVFDESESREFVLKYHFFLVEGVDFRKCNCHFVRAKICVIG